MSVQLNSQTREDLAEVEHNIKIGNFFGVAVLLLLLGTFSAGFYLYDPAEDVRRNFPSYLCWGWTAVMVYVSGFILEISSRLRARRHALLNGE